MTSVVFDPDARAEFLAAIRYYEDCRRGLGRRFRDAVSSAIQKIVKSPFMYRIIRASFRRYLLPRFPYAIIYSIEPDHIRIIAVAHASRKPGYWQRRIGQAKDLVISMADDSDAPLDDFQEYMP